MIVILTGAGISRESGIATFRDKGGVWENVRIEDVATPGAFTRDPDRVYAFYNTRRRELTSGSIHPNAAHFALARLEKELGRPVFIVTQNVDDLHERAGSRALLHMHGELLKARCTACDTVLPWKEDFDASSACSGCGRAGALRPHVVWFEEMPLHMEEIEDALRQCHTFVSIGTSGNVYPAAGFARAARAKGAHVLELNLEPSMGAQIFHTGYYGPATQIVPAWVESTLRDQPFSG